MKYTYRFANGDTIIVEVDEEMYRALLREDRLEYNNDQTNMSRAGRFVSLDMLQGITGMQFADPKSLPPTESDVRIQLAIESLSPEQRALVKAIYEERIGVSEYARREGVTQSAISHRLQTIQKKIKKYLSDPHI